MQISYSLATIKTAAHQLWQFAHQYRVWTFNGAMGAGKTTLVHALCDVLGVQDAVSSPTFALVNEYHFFYNDKEEIIYHMDWYRLRNAAEAINAGMEDTLTGGHYCFVEWAENAAELLPRQFVHISIEETGEGMRMLTAQINGSHT